MSDVNMDDIAREIEEINAAREAAGGGIKRVKLRDGVNIMRFLPAAVPQGKWFHKIWQHWGILEQRRPLTCDRTYDKDCYACNVVQMLREREQTDLANRWNSRVIYYTNVIALTDQVEAKKGVQLSLLSRKAFLPVLQFISGAYSTLLDPVQGRAVVINRSGRGFDTDYTVYPDANLCPLQDWANISKQLYDLSKLVRPASLEQMQGAINRALSGAAPIQTAPTPLVTMPLTAMSPMTPVSPLPNTQIAVPAAILAPRAPAITAPMAAILPVATAPVSVPTGSPPPTDMQARMAEFLAQFEKGSGNKQ